MTDEIPQEKLDAIRNGEWTIEQEIAAIIAHAPRGESITDLAAKIAAAVLPLIRSAERARLAEALTSDKARMTLMLALGRSGVKTDLSVDEIKAAMDEALSSLRTALSEGSPE